MDCDCYVDEDRDNADEISYASINYCPLHAHAADYKLALERIRGGPHLDTCSPTWGGKQFYCSCHVGLADAALKGGE